MAWRCKREWLMVLVVALSLHQAADGATKLPVNGLEYDFYGKNTKCGKAEKIVRETVEKAWKADRSVAPALLRLVYSDCFVRGCDASVLLDGERSEKTAPQNAGLRGFEIVDEIKQELETQCPGVVSCADVLHLAARDAVALAGGWNYPVFTGRRDGNISNAIAVDLPSPYISWNDALAYFDSHGLDVLDLGTLLGAHTMGVTHCRYVHDRIYNFNDTGLPDDQMDCRFARQLAQTCPYHLKPGQADPTVFLNPDSGSNYSFSSSYYTRVIDNRAVLGIDQQFITSKDGLRIADEFSHGFSDFQRYFAFSMSRMGSLGVLTGKKGEIRKNCRFTNARYPTRT
ncbi:putative peroxidase 61 [Canna indica]|uniref:Peroxidase n=1 Tax=Canna indica TaxID=4628 RepID=A0AAQ3Q2W3_9LILI|nr:putative peroxidase 61 [Canna indica]